MTHLCANRPDGATHATACGEWTDGDRISAKRQQCTCSGCFLNERYHDAYMLTLAMPAYRNDAAIQRAKEQGLIP